VKSQTQKVSLTIPEGLLERIDKKAEELSLSRSSYITMKLAESEKQETAMESLKDLILAIKDKEGKK
jgi:metal-responsive CopG/Arc/MetJ family transcriptional regulator